MPISSADIKRQILMDSENNRTEFLKKLQVQLENPDREGEILEIGGAFEPMVQSKGWLGVEAYMLRRMDLVGLAFTKTTDDGVQKGFAQAYIELMQYVDRTIKRRNEIITKETGQESETDKPDSQ